MTTTAAGDAAVARLNKATEAFEKIITGASNQVVDVPGYGNQPTLAARVDERLDETTATAAAEADRSRDEADRATTQANAAANSVTLAAAEYNKAQIQADRAQSEADRAAQITGLDTVSDAVALAALPLPDVWAPLSDSLRLITGYGRDVLVGSDVVARMVNFSRSSTATYIGKDGSLKTAAANEPRFEKEGLLIEGQSTNLVPWSSGYNGETPAWTAFNYSMSKRPDGVLITPAAGVAEKCVRVGNNLFPDLPDRPLSITVDVKGNGYDMVVLGFRSTYISAVDNGIGVSLVDGTVKRTSHGLTVTRFEPLADGFVRITVSTPSYTATTSDWRALVIGCGSMSEGYKAYSAHDADGVKGVIVRNIQLEALPFASSYIPTNGAAVTRAADIVTIPWAMNVKPATVTVALNYDLIGVGQSSQRLIEYAAPAAPRYLMQVTPAGSFESYCGASPLTVSNPTIGPGSIAVASTSPTRHALRLTGKSIATATPTGPAGATSNVTIGAAAGGTAPMFGHVRNLRIWHRALSDEQIKAVA